LLPECVYGFHSNIVRNSHPTVPLSAFVELSLMAWLIGTRTTMYCKWRVK